MGLVVKDHGWRIPDWLWVELEPRLLERPAHPLGCQNPRVPDRDASERDLVCAPDRQPVERLGRDRDLLLEVGSSAPPGMGTAGVLRECGGAVCSPPTSEGIEWEWSAMD
jgi:hypothetical protein